MEKRLADKQAAAEAHRKQMEGIKDPTQLTAAMQQHFQMTEEILALMLERRKLTAAQAPMSSASPVPPDLCRLGTYDGIIIAAPRDFMRRFSMPEYP